MNAIKNTVKVATGQKYSQLEIRCISSSLNEGKGSAVARGMKEIEKQNLNNGDCIVLVADADGSGDISCVQSMLSLLTNLIEMEGEPISWHTAAMVVGVRGFDNASTMRKITRWGFRETVKLFCGNLRVTDTQCGFKLMTLSAGRHLYRELNLKGWSHDVEVLYRAKLDRIPVSETAINWVDKEGSKLANSVMETVLVSLKMLFEVLLLRYQYTFGGWK